MLTTARRDLELRYEGPETGLEGRTALDVRGRVRPESGGIPACTRQLPN